MDKAMTGQMSSANQSMKAFDTEQTRADIHIETDQTVENMTSRFQGTLSDNDTL